MPQTLLFQNQAQPDHKRKVYLDFAQQHAYWRQHLALLAAIVVIQGDQSIPCYDSRKIRIRFHPQAWLLAEYD